MGRGGGGGGCGGWTERGWVGPAAGATPQGLGWRRVSGGPGVFQCALLLWGGRAARGALALLLWPVQCTLPWAAKLPRALPHRHDAPTDVPGNPPSSLPTLCTGQALRPPTQRNPPAACPSLAVVCLCGGLPLLGAGGHPGRGVDPGCGREPHHGHDGGPLRLVHLAPAQVGRAHPRLLLRRLGCAGGNRMRASSNIR